MKHRMISWTVRSLAAGLLLAFAAGLLWSLIPMVGKTLPNHVEEVLGISFAWSALLVSFLLGLICVSAFVLTALIQTLEYEQQLDR